MNRISSVFVAAFVPVLFAANSSAGTITYVGIPATQSDSNCGISRAHGYTTAVDGGNTRGTDRILNGITLFSLSGSGKDSATADNCTFSALSSTLTDAGVTSKNIAADGTVRELLSDMVFNNAGGDNSHVEIVLDPESLEQGSTYDLRVYVCSASGQNRQVNLAFFGDGQTGVETGFFNEDDARTSAGDFPAANQVYYINYRFTWDGDSAPGITITQKFGGAPFCLYALTNELVEEADNSAVGGENGQAAQAAGDGEQGEGDGNLSSGYVDQESDQVGVQSDDFYGSESLNSNGRWVKLSKWGTCWQPTDVPNGWCPYTNGSWKECDDCGWTFVSDEPWAWACYHYGRWAKVGLGCGWAWVPGKVWAPSWVSWRQGKDESSIGWAPLPPEAACKVNVGISSWVDETCDIGPECYTFVNIRDFGADSYFGCGCIYERWRNPIIIVDTFNCTNIVFGRRVGIFCGGPDWYRCNQRIRQLGGKECGKIHVNRYDNPNRLGGKWSKHDGNQLGLVSPKIHGNARSHPKIAESVGADKIDHGWKGLKDKKQEQQIRNHIAEENKGKNPKNSSAKLPEDVAQKRRAQHGRSDAQNGGQTGDKLRPGDKANAQNQGQGLQTGGNQNQPGGDQHPTKGARKRGQAQLTNGDHQATSFDQHPGKNRGAATQDRKAGERQQQQLAGGSQNVSEQQHIGRWHPGQSFKKQKIVNDRNPGAAKALENNGGGQAPHANNEKQGQPTVAELTDRHQKGFKGAKARGSPGQRLKGQNDFHMQTQQQGEGTGTPLRSQGFKGAKAQGSGGQQLHSPNAGQRGGRNRHRRQQSGGGQAQSGTHGQLQQQPSQQQQNKPPQQQNKSQQQHQMQQHHLQNSGGGGGASGSRRKRGQGTPPPH